MNAHDILIFITNLFSSYLDELYSIPPTDFIQGEITAYVECLEIISEWKFADKALKQKLKDKYLL